jgi:hypothetical protein
VCADIAFGLGGTDRRVVHKTSREGKRRKEKKKEKIACITSS